MLSTNPSSFTQSVYEQLRMKLLNGSLRPGDKLKISDLCSALSANLGAVREALARLTSEGLVISEPQRGFRAAPITMDDLRHLTEARIQIEGLCLVRAIKLGNVAWETGIVAALHTLLRTPRSENVTEEWAAVHNDFHRALVSACDNSWLIRMREMLATQSERYRWLSVAAARKKRDLNKEHSKLADAVLARQSDVATKLMKTHLLLTTEALLETGLVDDDTSTKHQAAPRGKTAAGRSSRAKGTRLHASSSKTSVAPKTSLSRR